MSFNGTERRIGAADIAVLQTEVENLKVQVAEMRTDIKCLLAVVNQTKGGWKIIVLVAGVAGTMGALIGKLLPFLR